MATEVAPPRAAPREAQSIFLFTRLVLGVTADVGVEKTAEVPDVETARAVVDLVLDGFTAKCAQCGTAGHKIWRVRLANDEAAVVCSDCADGGRGARGGIAPAHYGGHGA